MSLQTLCLTGSGQETVKLNCEKEHMWLFGFSVKMLQIHPDETELRRSCVTENSVGSLSFYLNWLKGLNYNI